MEDKRELEEELRINESLEAKLEDQELGTHMCCIYRDKEEQLSALSSFMSLGIERNEKCLYIVDDRTKTEVIEAFEKLDFDVEKFIKSNQFEFLTKSETYLKDGYFDPDEMIELLDKAQEQALNEGYVGLRVAGEMTWVFSEVPGVENLMEYETKLNEFLPDQKIIAICQYNEERFTPETLVDVIRTHPKVLIYDDLHENLFYMPPKVFKAQQKGKVTKEHYEQLKEDIIQRTRLKRKEKKTEEELRQSKRQLEAIFNDPETFIGVIDTDGTLREGNESALEFVSDPPSKVEGKKFWNTPWWTHSPELQQKLKKAIERAKTGEIVRFEATHIGKNRKEITVDFSLRPVRNDEDEIVSLIASGKNITRRKKAEERFKKLFNASPDPTYLVDEDGVFQEVNEAAIETLGYEREDIIGKHLLEVPFFPSETKEKIVENFEKRLEGKEFSPYRIKAETKNGELLFAEINATLIKEGGDVTGTIGIARDITEQKKAEERKDFLNTLLRQDLRSKYQIIQGYHQMLGEEAVLSEELREYLEKSIGAAREADGILELAKKLEEIEKTEWKAEKDVLKVLEHVTQDLSNILDEYGIKIEENYPEKISKVEGGYSLNILISQILLTRIRLSKCDDIRIDVKERKEDILLTIEDNGKRLPNGIKNLFSGDIYTGETTGIGGARYYMLREIAEYNDARIEVKDSDMSGVRFEIHLERVQ